MKQSTTSMKDDKVSNNYGTVSVHLVKGTHCVFYADKYFLSPLDVLQNHRFTPNKNKCAKCLYSEYQILIGKSFCGLSCYCVIYCEHLFSMKLRAAVFIFFH